MSAQQEIDFEEQRMEKKFWEFHTNNPMVYDFFVNRTQNLIQAGRKFYGAKAIFEVIRYHINIETQGEEFKINNNYISGYVRMFVKDFPEHNKFFRMRFSAYDEKITDCI